MIKYSSWNLDSFDIFNFGNGNNGEFLNDGIKNNITH